MPIVFNEKTGFVFLGKRDLCLSYLVLESARDHSNKLYDDQYKYAASLTETKGRTLDQIEGSPIEQAGNTIVLLFPSSVEVEKIITELQVIKHLVMEEEEKNANKVN